MQENQAFCQMLLPPSESTMILNTLYKQIREMSMRKEHDLDKNLGPQKLISYTPHQVPCLVCSNINQYEK